MKRDPYGREITNFEWIVVNAVAPIVLGLMLAIPFVLWCKPEWLGLK